MQTMAWDSKARVAIAEEDLASAADCVNNAQMILEKFDIPNPAWRLHATAYDLFTQAGKKEEAERHRSRAETVIWCRANSLPEDEPLRATFLAAEPVRRILGGSGVVRVGSSSTSHFHRYKSDLNVQLGSNARSSEGGDVHPPRTLSRVSNSEAWRFS